MKKSLLSLALLLAAHSAWAGGYPAPSPRVEMNYSQVSVALVDARTSRALDIYGNNVGRAYVAGEEGQTYRVVVRNRTGADILVVPSIDGLNALTGKPASPDQSGYIVPA